MNNYEVTKCQKCGEVIVTSEQGTIKVKGWEELRKVIKRLKAGESIESVALSYCSYCLFPIADHASEEEYGEHSDWLPYHKPQPQGYANRYF